MQTVSWVKDHFAVVFLAVANFATILGAISARSAAAAAKDQVRLLDEQIGVSKQAFELSQQATEAAERAAQAAEGQLQEAIHAATVAKETAAKAEAQAEISEKRASRAEERAELAHEHMKDALRPVLVLARRTGVFQEQIFKIENEGRGPAHSLTWDFCSAGELDRIVKAQFDQRLLADPGTNLLAQGSGHEIRFDYDRFMKAGIVFRYRSVDGRVFFTLVRVGVGQGFLYQHVDSGKISVQ